VDLNPDLSAVILSAVTQSEWVRGISPFPAVPKLKLTLSAIGLSNDHHVIA
jgi:hypothetical protein